MAYAAKQTTSQSSSPLSREHSEEEEKQSNHPAESSVNIVKGLIKTLNTRDGVKSEDNDWTVSPADTTGMDD